MSHQGSFGEEAARATREVAARAIRRLDVLEWVILSGAILLALAGGALVALLLSVPFGFPFGITWIAASLLLFGIPGAVALRRIRREERERTRRLTPNTKGPDV